MKRKEQRTKTKPAGLLLLLVVAFGLLNPMQVGATGACLAGRVHGWQDMGCNQNNAGEGGVPKAKCPNCPPCCYNGMPHWWVSEPYIDLCMSDTPLSYTLSSGQEMAFKFYYRQRTVMPDFDEIPSLNSFFPRSFPGIVNGSNCGTNASWRNNWTMGITFWDADWESQWRFTGTFWFPPVYYAIFSQYYEALVFRPEGGMNYFYDTTNGTSLQDPRSQMRLQPISTPLLVTTSPSADANGIYWGDPNVGFSLTYPDGSQDIFSLTDFSFSPLEHTSWGGSGTSTTHAFLTQRIDPQGRVTRLGYEASTNINSGFSYRLKDVVDPDGRTNTFRYAYGYQIAEIDDPYGRKTTLGYGTLATSNLLTRITDAAGITNTFQYQSGQQITIPIYCSDDQGDIWQCGSQVVGYSSAGWITSLTTPYGTTAFTYYEVDDGDVTDGVQQRAIYISEPEGAQQLYYYLHTNSAVSATNISPNVPGQSFDNGSSGSSGHQALSYRNTYYWGRRQFAALSYSFTNALSYSLSMGLANLTGADYNKARLRHWLLLGADDLSLTESMSSERDPSPDAAGLTPGLRTWYNYVGQPSVDVLGSNPQVSCIARLLPDGSSQYITYNYYPAGQPGAGFVSDNESSYSRANGTVGVLTNWFAYAANSVDLISVSNSAGQSWTLGYNGSHQITFITNALNQVTALGWNPNLNSIQWPGGQSVSLAYGGNDYGRLQTVSWSPSGRSFTITAYTNGLPQTVTDDRGVIVANTWDGLNRLTSTVFPDGTSVSNIYNRLDLGTAKDRLGNWTRYTYDGLQHLTTVTNANNGVTIYSWCGCGSLSAIYDAQNGLANPTYLNYDNQGNLVNVLYPDNTSLTYQFDLAGRMTNAFDGAGRSVQLGYNNQGLATNISGAFGTLESIVFDALNRPISVTDANGVTVNNSYDTINELVKRTWPDGISEGFGYSAAGLIAYTNRDQKITLYGRDTAGRLTAVTNANHEVTQFGYDSLNNITNLVDGLQHTTTWQYNEYGWLTNKVDALNRNIVRYGVNPNGWVTSRQTPEKGNTTYGYDNIGNLKTISYPGSSISYAYDALNRLTNMVDAFGTTAFGYTPAGQLQSENGPWANDTVTYTLQQRLRTAMSLSQPGGSWSQTYGYDSMWRMTNVISPAGTFGYSYNSAVSPLVSGISLTNGANIVNSYDGLARLTSTKLLNSGSSILDSYTYGYDPLGLRTNVTRNLGSAISTATAGYDAIGQLTGWMAKETNTVRLNEQLGWAYDAAHNLHGRTNGALIQTFTVDTANQLTNVGRTGTFTVAGDTLSAATRVTVNGQSAQAYADNTFASSGGISLNNGQNTFTTIAQNAGGTRVTNTASSYLPSTNSLFYDANGNLTNDGLRSLSYDNENQLTNVMIPGQWRATYVYDGLGRRRVARDYTWQSGNWVPTNEVHYVYDKMLPVQERDMNNNPLVTYTRGIDLSGRLQRAGGIGGLLARTDGNGSTYYHADGAGNITALMNGSQNIVAQYLYNPYGKLVGEWGGMADANKYRFSSKEWDPLSGMYYYGFRFYDPNLQRWPNHDPIGEPGFEVMQRDSPYSTHPFIQIPVELTEGPNIYEFVGNDPLQGIDPFGLDLWLIKDSSGLIKHHYVIGNNPDGSYWESDFGPDIAGHSLLDMVRRLNHKGKTEFHKCSAFDPKKLGNDFSMTDHLPLSSDVDAKVRDEAERRANDPNQPRYDALGNSCIDYANGLYYYGVGAQIRSKMGN